MPESRLALIVAVSEYQDSGLRQLVAPVQDAETLARVLGDPVIGDFAVKTLLNQPSHQINREIEAFFANRAREDLLLLYFSGHGLKDEAGRLYFAAPNTDRKFLKTTTIAANLLHDVMDACRSRRKVLILDCCHSGAFARGMTHRTDETVGTGDYFRGGRGQFVLTASDAIQYAFEGDAVSGEGVCSVFTDTLVRGLETGEADLDGDGTISCDELYDYLHERITDRIPQQKPRKWAFDVEGDIIIAHNPRPVAKLTALPAELRQSSEDPRPWVREGAAGRLGDLLQHSNKGMAAAARTVLQQMAEDDSLKVRSVAIGILKAHTAQKPSATELNGSEIATSENVETTLKANEACDIETTHREEASSIPLAILEKEPATAIPKKVTGPFITLTISKKLLVVIVLSALSGTGLYYFYRNHPTVVVMENLNGVNETELEQTRNTNKDLKAALEQTRNTNKDLKAALEQTRNTNEDLKAALEQTRNTNKEAKTKKQQQDKVASSLGMGAEFQDILRDGGRSPVMIVIPGGRFMMGSPQNEPGRDTNNERQHPVEVDRFALGKYEVTFEEYDLFAEATNRARPQSPQDPGRGQRPVINVTWSDAVAYADWLSQQTGRTYRLPKETEWEYAVRAGTTTPFYFGNTIKTNEANCNGDSYNNGSNGERRNQSIEVGQSLPNDWGLYDMHGNVWEWTCSAYNPDYRGSDMCIESNNNRDRVVVRGGSWYEPPGRCRSAARGNNPPNTGYKNTGFRLARDLPH